MPRLPGQELGEPPPPVPREFPKGFAFRTRWSGNIATIAGGMFFMVAALFFVAALKASSFFALVPLFFMTGGFFMFRHGWQHATRVLRAYRHGIASEGKVYTCSVDRTQHVNGNHPYKLVWHFSVEGHQYEGTLTSFDSTLGSRGRGQPLWVLYYPGDPGQNTIYPPVR
jgi:hypothetical protein